MHGRVGDPALDLFQVSSPDDHQLAPRYPALRRIRNRKDLLRSTFFAELRPELERVLRAVECGTHPRPARPARPGSSTWRTVAWNIQRGARFDALLDTIRTDALLRDADVLLLSEVDCGMARSGHRHVARELAAALGMHYAFAVSYLVLGDDLLENPGNAENTLALAGQALLSRLPLHRAERVDLPELKDKFSSRSEKRLGKKCAVLADVELPSGAVCVGCCHLDSNASPSQRAAQLEALIARADDHPLPVLLGGDFNTSTYDVSGPAPLALDLLHKFFFTGFDATVEGYMTPERRYEQPIFATLARHGLQVDGFNDRSQGTFVYDMNQPYTIAKLHQKVGRTLTALLVRRLRKWNGVVPARLDWFAARGPLAPAFASVVQPALVDGRPVSDHAAIVVDVALRSRPA